MLVSPGQTPRSCSSTGRTNSRGLGSLPRRRAVSARPIAGPTLPFPVFYADRSPSRMGQIIYFVSLLSNERTRETRRGMGEGEYVASANRRVERRVEVANAEADRALTEERQRADRLNKQVEALSAEVMRAEEQAEAAIGRADRAEASRDAERARAWSMPAVGDVPLVEMRFRCANCGSRLTDFVVTATEATGRPR